MSKIKTKDIVIYVILGALFLFSVAVFIGSMQINSGGRLGGNEMLILLVGLPFGLLLYFLPSIVGRKKRNYNAIFVLNLLLGWSLIGWVVAMVWAVSQDTKISQASTQSATDELEKLLQLKEKGALSEEEFLQQKKRILG